MLIRSGDSSARHVASENDRCHQQPIREAISDGVITSKIRTELLAYSITAAYDIRVDTIGGVVELTGFVDSTTVSAAAVDIARNAAGVQDVHDEMDCRRTGDVCSGR